MKCTSCKSSGSIVRRGVTFLDDVFKCSCGQVYTREHSIMTEDARIDEAMKESAAIDESNRSLEVEFSDCPSQNGWAGSDGLP